MLDGIFHADPTRRAHSPRRYSGDAHGIAATAHSGALAVDDVTSDRCRAPCPSRMDISNPNCSAAFLILIVRFVILK